MRILRIFVFGFSHVTTDKFYIQPVDSGIDELLVIDRVSQEISLQGKERRYMYTLNIHFNTCSCHVNIHGMYFQSLKTLRRPCLCQCYSNTDTNSK